MLAKLRIVLVEDRGNGDLRVHVARIHVVQRLLLREALLLLGESERRARELHEVFGVGLVHDREVRRESRRLSEPAQQPVRGRVEGPAVHGAARAPDQPFGAAEHLLRGATREREEQDALRTDAALEQVRDAIHERAGLARPRARDDQQRAVRVRTAAFNCAGFSSAAKSVLRRGSTSRRRDG